LSSKQLQVIIEEEPKPKKKGFLSGLFGKKTDAKTEKK